ncbi:MAG: neutral/alkaline non-lysosomal ceramidase N-terminal domain-containing protein [Verrucomicrobia bacterium]|nr:neutral/alkaline non-lysosomal ceramidase N-terminal domain-containing protein [Verrucomicrobiota bacterium]
MTLHAGAAVRDISPDKPTALYGYPHVERVSTGIHDPLLVSVLWLDQAGSRLVMVALDLLMLEPTMARAVRRRVAAALRIPESGIFISCTHTHSGPVTMRFLGWRDDLRSPLPDPAYLDWVCDQVVEAAEAAMASAVTAEVAWTSADATGVGGNRLKAGGVTDPECGILAVRHAKTRTLMAVSLIYGMHPTVLHEDSTLISSDFPHYARLSLQEQFGDGVTVLYHTAPAGNQSPRFFVKAQTFAEAERLGRQLGTASVAALRGIGEADWSAAPRLDSALESVVLPRRQLQPLAAAHAILDKYRRTHERLKQEGAPNPEVRTAECAVFGAEVNAALAKAEARGDIDRLLAQYLPIEVQVLRIGKVDVVGLPGELFTEYALAIKQGAGTRIFVVSLVNGELQGYVVTPEAAAAGGYEATNAMFAPESGGILVKTALALVTRLTGG